jgi:hypothetical protein
VGNTGEVIIVDIINWLEKWYASNCNGDWEHTFGVEISTLDNPGWRVQFNITETMYQDIAFNDVIIERTDDDWVHCKKNNGNIDCAGGPKNLGEMLGIVKKWMSNNDPYR